MASLCAGACRTPLSPPTGILMMGYGRRNGVATGTQHELMCRALALEAGDTRWAVATVELLCFAEEWCAPIAKRVAHRTGIPEDAIWICATHTHSAPAYNLWKAPQSPDGPPKAGRDVAWEYAVQERIADCIVGAWEARQPAQVGFGESEAQIGANRRCPTADDGVRLIPYDDGPVDTAVTVMDLRTAEGEPLAVFVNHACHGVILTEDNLLYTGDWLGLCATQLEAELGPDVVALVAQGACGNIDPIQRGSFPLAEAAADCIARAVHAALQEATYTDDMTLEVSAIPLELQLKDTAAAVARGEAHVAQVQRNIERHVAPHSTHTQRLQDELQLAQEGLDAARAMHEQNARFPRADIATGTLTCTARLLTINHHAIVGVPGEPFTELSLALREHIAPAPVFVLGYCHDYIGYIPTRDAYAHGGYEVLSSRLAPGGHERLLEALLAAVPAAAGHR